MQFVEYPFGSLCPEQVVVWNVGAAGSLGKAEAFLAGLCLQGRVITRDTRCAGARARSAKAMGKEPLVAWASLTSCLEGSEHW